MKRPLQFFLFEFSFFNFQFANAQSVQNQVTVYFVSGAQRSISAQDTSASITSQNILNILSKYNLNSDSVHPAFPGFNQSDTLFTDSLGFAVKQMDKTKIFFIRTSNSVIRDSLIANLKNLSEVLFVEPNGIVTGDVIPNDTKYSQQWGLKNSPSSPSTTVDVIGGGIVNLHYTDLCGVAQTAGGPTLYSSCPRNMVAYKITPNPAQNNILVSSVSANDLKSNSSSLIYAIKILDHYGTAIKSFTFKT